MHTHVAFFHSHIHASIDSHWMLLPNTLGIGSGTPLTRDNKSFTSLISRCKLSITPRKMGQVVAPPLGSCAQTDAMRFSMQEEFALCRPMTSSCGNSRSSPLVAFELDWTCLKH